MYTVTYQVPFCTSTRELVPVHQAWTAPTISNIHWLEWCTAVLSQRSGFESQQVWIFGGLSFHNRLSWMDHALLHLIVLLLTQNILSSLHWLPPYSFFFFQNFGLFPVWFQDINDVVLADNPQNKLSKCFDIPVFLPFSFSQKFSSFFVFCSSFFCSLLAKLPRFQTNIPMINLISKQIYHQIDGILLATSKFGQCQLVMKN